MFRRVNVCIYMHIDMDVLRLVHEYAFVFMFATIFTVTFCAHRISFENNLVCFCSVFHIIAKERRRRLGHLPVCMDWGMVFHAFSAGMHFMFSYRFFAYE